MATTTSHEYQLQDVDFLSRYPEIKHLSISEGINNIDAIHTLGNLESLMISGKNRKVDFSKFPPITELTADWSPYFVNMDKCLYLNQLSL